MRTELDKALVAKYPLIFKDRNGDPRQTLMCFGFEHGDGWYNILDVLCGLLYSKYSVAKERFEVAQEIGVGGIIYGDKVLTQEDYDKRKADMEDAAQTVPVAVQIKEKFGGLRFYVDRASDEHYNYIHFAESMSYHTCELCGKLGKLYTDGWHTVLCDEHAKELDRSQEYVRE